MSGEEGGVREVVGRGGRECRMWVVSMVTSWDVFSSLSSKLMRRLALVAHFSPLISGCGDHAYFLDNAPVLQVPWSNIAIHVLHKEVILCLNDLCEYYSATTSCTCIYVSVFTGAPIPHLTSHRYHVVTCCML